MTDTLEQAMAVDRVKLLEDAIAMRGLKTAREIGALHGVSRCVVIGLWFRAKLPLVPMKTRGRLISRARRIAGVGNGYRMPIKPIKPSYGMPSKAKLAATLPSKPDWWTEMYLMDGAKV